MTIKQHACRMFGALGFSGTDSLLDWQTGLKLIFARNLPYA